MSYIDDFIALLVKAAKEETSQSEMEALRKQFLRMMTANNSTPKYTVPEVGTDSDKLDGQHGSYYRDASNMNAGTMSTDRFSAYGDLTAETKIGTGAAQVAAGDHGHSHTALTDIGTNTHAQIDTHLGSTANPHTVTKAQIGLGSVANILDKLDAVTAPTINDDSGDGYAVGSLWVDVTADQTYICVDATVGAAVWVGASSTDAAAIHDNVAGEIAAITEKTTPADADVALIEDSAAGSAKKKVTWANIKAALKSYFDTLYAPISVGTWTAYTPTVTASSGTLTTVSASGNYFEIGNLVSFYVTVAITDMGTGAGTLYITPPSNTSGAHMGVGRENSVTGDLLQAMIHTNLIRVLDYAGSSCIGSGRTYYLSGTYRKA